MQHELVVLLHQEAALQHLLTFSHQLQDSRHSLTVTHMLPDDQLVLTQFPRKFSTNSGEVSGASEASEGDGIPVELFQMLKDDAVKVLHSI